MIEIKNLHKSYTMGSNSLHVLKGINFSVAEGELVSIMRSSGSKWNFRELQDQDWEAGQTRSSN
jgi:predicted ABC-type transport system involved in lysophospholipase L1 biosynthesis ATPase subunit